MGWDQFIVMGHSASGRVVVSLGAHFGSKLAGVIAVDPLLAAEPGGGGGAADGQSAPHLRIDRGSNGELRQASNPPRLAHDVATRRKRAVRIESGFMLKRDPDNANTTPVGEGAGMPTRPRTDVWKDG